MSDGRPAYLDRDYRLLYGLMAVVGCLTIAGWVWAGWLVLVPTSARTDGGTSLECGSPALFDEAAFADSLADPDLPDEAYDQDLASVCANTVDWHVRGAVAISVVAAPLAALWVWSAGALRLRRASGPPVSALPGDTGESGD